MLQFYTNFLSDTIFYRISEIVGIFYVESLLYVKKNYNKRKE